MINKKRRIIFIFIWLVILGGLIFLNIYLPKELNSNERIFKKYYAERMELFKNENQYFKDNNISVDVVFIGDSITCGFESEREFYEEDYVCSFRGIGGDNTFLMEDRLQVSLYDVNPKVVVMCIGGNNIYTMLENYEDILIDIKTNLPNSYVILQPIYPTNLSIIERNETIPSINVELYRLAEKYNYNIVDTHNPLKDETGAMDLKYTDDGAHLNAAANKIVREIIKAEIDKLLK